VATDPEIAILEVAVVKIYTVGRVQLLQDLDLSAARHEVVRLQDRRLQRDAITTVVNKKTETVHGEWTHQLLDGGKRAV
jgi:hypothetical protein